MQKLRIILVSIEHGRGMCTNIEARHENNVSILA